MAGKLAILATPVIQQIRYQAKSKISCSGYASVLDLVSQLMIAALHNQPR